MLKRWMMILFSIVGLLIITLIVYVAVNRLWVNSVENSFLVFLGSSSTNNPAKLHEISSDFDVDKYDYICILGPYQTTVEYKNKNGNAPDYIYGIINSNLKKVNYREGWWGLLSSEAHWVLILFNQKIGLLRTDEISNNLIPLISLSGGRDCYAVEGVSVVKENNSQYPYGAGLRFISNK